MYTITPQLADCPRAERLREAGRARHAASVRAACNSARRGGLVATPASWIIRVILLRTAV